MINGSLQTVDLSSRASLAQGEPRCAGNCRCDRGNGCDGCGRHGGNTRVAGPARRSRGDGRDRCHRRAGHAGPSRGHGRERHRRRSRRDRSDRLQGGPGATGASGPQGDPGPAALFAAVNADGTIGSERGVVAGPGTGKQGTGIYAVVFDRNISQCVPLVTMGIPFGANTAAGGTAEAIFVASTQIGIATRDLTGALSNESFFLAVVC